MKTKIEKKEQKSNLYSKREEKEEYYPLCDLIQTSLVIL